ncbi:MAG TPA: hypothetical protein VFG64_10290 [Dongiaceae bacterium]|nr:hypothetical protein [Dongiaceae bacterium]
MSTEKAPNNHSGPLPAKKRSVEGEGFDLFKTFRHSPKPTEGIRPIEDEEKPKE